MCGGQLWTSLHDVMWYSESTVLTNRWRLCLKDYRKRESIIIMANTYKNQIRCHNFYSGSDYYWKNINHNRVALQFCAEHLFFCVGRYFRACLMSESCAGLNLWIFLCISSLFKIWTIVVCVCCLCQIQIMCLLPVQCRMTKGWCQLWSMCKKNKNSALTSFFYIFHTRVLTNQYW